MRTGPAADAPGADDSGIAATVGDEVITNQRLDVLLGPRLQETRQDIYRMKKEKLDQLIIEMILDKEAKQQGKTVENLVEQIAPAGSAQVEESEIDKYMQDNQQRLQAYKGSLPELRQRIKTFLEQQKRSQVITNYAHALESKIRRPYSFARALSAQDNSRHPGRSHLGAFRCAGHHSRILRLRMPRLPIDP